MTFAILDAHPHVSLQRQHRRAHIRGRRRGGERTPDASVIFLQKGTVDMGCFEYTSIPTMLFLR